MYNKYNYKLETHLSRICELNEEYRNLCSSWELSKKTYKKILQNISMSYPHYSLHDDSHSESIITNIEMLLGKGIIEKLSPTDTWLILNCAYLHDFGMVLLYSKIEDEWETKEFQTFLKESENSFDQNLKEACEYLNNFNNNTINSEKIWPLKVRTYVTEIISAYFRGKHSNITKEYLNKLEVWELDLTQNGLIQNRLVNMIGEICFMHTKNFEDVMKLDYISNGYNSDYVHPRFIAELIRLGDVLDLDNGRFNEYTEKVTGHMPKTSIKHKEKHQSVNHVLITPERIEVRYDCNDGEIYREARRWIDYIESEIRDITMNYIDIIPKHLEWHPPKLTRRELLLKGKPDTHNLCDLKFEISQEKAFHIIEGANIYSDKLTFIREFIQNALDATKIQLYRDLKKGIYDFWIEKDVLNKGVDNITPFDIPVEVYKNYEINIDIKPKGKAGVKVIIKDKGTGISIEDLKNMCNVGKSYDFRKNHKMEISEMPLWLKPTGGFGIGIQSAFLVTDEIKAFTKSDNDVSLEIDFASSKHNRYINVKPSDKNMKRGTEFHIEFEDGEINIDESELVNSKYDRFSDENILISKVRNYIIKHIKKTIVPIKIEDLQYKGIVDDTLDKLRSKTEEENYTYGIRDDLSEMYLWDKENSVYINLKSGMYSIVDDIKMKYVAFKGCYLYPDDWRFEYFDKLDIYGFDTKECLKVDRNGLTEIGVKKINQVVKKADLFSLKKIKARLDDMTIDDIKKSKIDILNFILKYCLHHKLSDKDKKKYKKLIDYDVFVLQLNEEKNKYETTTKPLKDLIEVFPDISYIDTLKNRDYSDENDVREDILESFNKSIKDTNLYEYIVTDTLLINKLNTLKKDSIKYIDKGNIYISKSSIYVDKDMKKIDDPGVIMDKETREFFIRGLSSRTTGLNISKSRIRCNIPAIKEYEVLAIIGDVEGNLESKVYIISPITSFDGDNMHNFINKEDFINSIVDREDYKTLLNYVYENTAFKGNVTKEDIDNKYKELIGEYFDLISKEVNLSVG